MSIISGCSNLNGVNQLHTDLKKKGNSFILPKPLKYMSEPWRCMFTIRRTLSSIFSIRSSSAFGFRIFSVISSSRSSIPNLVIVNFELFTMSGIILF